MSVLNFIKIARRRNETPECNLEQMQRDLSRRKGTSLVLDTNVVLDIARHVKVTKGAPNQQLLAKSGLGELVKLVSQATANHIPISISPGFVLPELEPAAFDNIVRQYHEFWTMYAPGLIDDPHDPNGERRERTPTIGCIECMPEDEAMVRRMPYLLLLCMLIAANDQALTTPMERYNRFLSLMRKWVDCFSAKEMLIARIVLGDLEARAKRSGWRLNAQERAYCNRLIDNFAPFVRDKISVSGRELQRLAHNGACDISFLNMVLRSETLDIGGGAYTVWFASFDGKLARFVESIFYEDLVGELGQHASVVLPGKLAAHPDLIMLEAIEFSHRVGRTYNFTPPTDPIWKERVHQLNREAEKLYPELECATI
ncbi:hypothetical protein [Chromobacterium rhizoryzae]|uniref:hypothetical protein n=1 Tax=Chromobacterium rhizoryzae TaxID=1778675 RepID=UPI001D066656|nr:hypothetical protein [Chromobacterium rhizoryzae]